MKNLAILLCPFLVFSILLSFVANDNSEPVKVCSWNIRDFGKSKSDGEIAFIANTVKDYDIIVLQEIVSGFGGAQAVARLNDELNRKGTKWDYSVSDPTYGDSYKTERYAYLWKPSKIKKIGSAWLEQYYKLEIDREPYYATFNKSGKEFTLVNFHAITKSKQPETEVKYFKFLPARYPDLNLIFCGDFNLPQSHTVFNPLKGMGYSPILRNQKTTLKREYFNGECLASEFDNAFFNKSKITTRDAKMIPFYQSFPTLKEAHMISDHAPISFELLLH